MKLIYVKKLGKGYIALAKINPHTESSVGLFLTQICEGRKTRNKTWDAKELHERSQNACVGSKLARSALAHHPPQKYEKFERERKEIFL